MGNLTTDAARKLVCVYKEYRLLMENIIKIMNAAHNITKESKRKRIMLNDVKAALKFKKKGKEC